MNVTVSDKNRIFYVQDPYAEARQEQDFDDLRLRIKSRHVELELREKRRRIYRLLFLYPSIILTLVAYYCLT